VNGDGYPEIIAPFRYVSQDPLLPAYDVSQMLVLDQTGKTIRTWNLSGINGQEAYNPIAIAGDFLGDGKSEIAAGYALVGYEMQIDQMDIQVGSTQVGMDVLSTGWSYNAAASDWPMPHRNSTQNAILRRVRSTAITLSSSANPSNGVSPTTLTLAVAHPSGGSGVPTGTVNLIDGDRNIGSCVLSSGGCSITPALAAGTHILTAGYVGDLKYDVSYSASITQIVNFVPTTTALTINPSGGTLTAGASYTLTATVTPSSGTTPPTGNVIFTIGSTTQTVALNSSGVATYSGTAPAAAGSLTISAAYQGSTKFSVSTSSTLTENVVTNPVPTISTISPAYKAAGSATYTLTVNGSGFISASTVYWGSVALTTQFISSTQLSAVVPATDISTAGITAITVQSPAPGGGTSNTLQFEVDSVGSGLATAPSFSTTAVAVSAGSTASYSVSLPSSASGVTVTCLNLPAGANCSYSALSGMVSITTSSTTPLGTYQVTVVFTETLAGSASLAFVIAPILLLPLFYLRRKVTALGALNTVCLALILLAGAELVTGCGGGGGSIQPVQPNPTHQVTSSGVVSLTVR
jgi:hypothetical protein